ncbi:DUF4312 family protein [Vallitalea maricola]|uniref:Uncharacterized protein n=1 Tax=Vallitalea maricola TaxID=3074433 RepID=A0ACB5UG25_9FIRM|nr:hypothetical protein AN2V17_06300 [Vallitalea sp. AN17-2]
MDEKQLLKVERKTLEVSGIGKTKEEAFGKILTNLRQEVYKDTKGLILKMDPIEVYLVEEKRSSEIEKFLFLFMPREKDKFNLTYKFIVEVRYVEKL